MRKQIEKAAVIAAGFMALSVPALALGGGRLAATQAVSGLAAEFSGPLAYGLSLIAIVGTAATMYRHHHDMGVLAQTGMGLLFSAGVALGATSLLGFIPGVAGALI